MPVKDFTKTISVNGSVNLYTLLAANGYAGEYTPRGGIHILNDNAQILYVHTTDQAPTGSAPATPTGGYPISSNGTTPRTELTIGKPVDLRYVWLHSAAAVNVIFLIVGA